MKIEIDEQKILTEILERDSRLHEEIKSKVRDELVEEVKDTIRAEYIEGKWDGTEEIRDSVIEDIRAEQERVVKKILKEFYESYRFAKKDLTILKKLKEILEIE